MSTLDERLNALNAARDLLQRARLDAAVPAAFRDLAADTARLYPSATAVEAKLFDLDTERVQQWGTALAMTRVLLELLMRRRPDLEEWRQRAIAVERHFPQACYLPGPVPTDRPWTADFLAPLMGLKDLAA